MKYLIACIVVVLVICFVGCTSNSSLQTPDGPGLPAEITSFEECAAAGYPIMESYPRQCRVGEQLFVEEITPTD